MHTIKLQIHDTIYDHIMFLLRHLNLKGLKIIEEDEVEEVESLGEKEEIRAFSNHTANLIEDWKDEDEDAVWK